MIINKHITIYDSDIYIGEFSNISELKSIDTTSATDYPLYTKVYISNTGQYFLDRNNTSAESQPDIVSPNTGVGRWILVPNSLHNKNILKSISEISNTIAYADSGTSGILKNTDWLIFNNKQNTLIPGSGITIVGDVISSTVTSLSVTPPLNYSTSGVLSIQVSNSTQGGYLTTSDWNTFNNKLNSININGSNGTNFTLTTSNISEGTNFYYTDARRDKLLSNDNVFSGTNSFGLLTTSTGSPSINVTNRTLSNTSGIVLDYTNTALYTKNQAYKTLDWDLAIGYDKFPTDANRTTGYSIAWNSRSLYDYANNRIALVWSSRVMYDSKAGSIKSMDWDQRILYSTSGTAIADYSTANFRVYNTPVGNTDAANKSYVDGVAAGKISSITINGSNGTNFILTTSNISEGTNFYYTDTKARNAISTTAPLNYASTSGVIGIFQSTSTSGGYLSSTDWNTFNNKQNSHAIGNLTETTSSILNITGGTGSVIGTGTSIQVKQAQNGTSGFLTASDWSTFNSKQNALPNASATSSGILTNTDWNTFNNKLNSVIINGSNGTNFTLTTSNISEGTNFYYTDSKARASISTTSPLNYNSTAGIISIFQSTSTSGGYLSNTDWNTFNNKQNALTTGNLTEATSNILTINGGTGSVIGTGTSIQVKQAQNGTSGFLSSTDWNTFNNKINTVIINGSNGTNFTLTTSNISEGTNFYYTDAKARNAISAIGPLSYASTSGIFSIFQASSTSGGYLNNTDWNTFNNKYSTSGGIIYGNVFRDNTGYTTSGAALMGFTSGGTSRFTFDGTNGYTGIQHSTSSAIQMYSFHSLILQGNRNNTSSPSYSFKSDVGVYVDYRNAEAATTAMAIEIDNTQIGDILKMYNNGIQVANFSSSGAFQLNNYFGASPITAPSEAIFHVIGNSDNSFKGNVIDVYGSNGAHVVLRKSRGSSTTPSSLQAGDVLGQYGFDGYGSGFSSLSSPLAFMRATANQNYSNGTKGTYLSFFTTSDSTITPIERLKVLATGDVEMLSTGYVKIPIGSTAQRPTVGTSGTAGLIRYNNTVSAYEAVDGTAWAHMGHLIPIQFSLIQQINNFSSAFYYSKEQNGVTGGKVSVDTGNGISSGSVDPWLAPFNCRIVGAVAYLKGMGVSSGTPAGPYLYRVDIYNNAATGTLLSTINFSFPNGTTVGSFSSSVSTYAMSEMNGLNINVAKGQNLGLMFVAVSTNASTISVQEGARVTLLIQKIY